MPRRRMIDPGFWEDPTMGTLSIPARLLFIGMISHADDEGRLEVEPRYLRRAVFGFDDVTVADVVELLDEIRRLCRSVQFYQVDGRSFAAFRNWHRYQYIQKAQASRLPPPPDFTPREPDPDDYHTDTIPVPDDHRNGNGTVSDNRIEKNRIEVNTTTTTTERASARDDGVPETNGVVVVVVDQGTKDERGTVARRFLEQHKIPEALIREILVACSDQDLTECLAGWNSIILAPPPGLHNPTGMMIKRLRLGDLTVPEQPARRAPAFDPETGIRMPEPSALTDEMRRARDTLEQEVAARNPIEGDFVSLKDFAARIAATSPQNSIDRAKMLQFKRAL